MPDPTVRSSHGTSIVRRVATGTLALVVATGALAAPVSFEDPRWIVQGQETEFVTVAGKQAVRLLGGSARLQGVAIEDGIIEFDMLVRQERGFSGAFWRRQDQDNAEQFYLRPHQSGNPDANQYQPLFNGSSSWQLYHGAGYSAPTSYRFDEWMHVRIAFQGRSAAFFVDSDEPAFTTDRLKHDPVAGGVGVYASNFAPAWFADFEVSELPDDFRIDVVPAENAPEPDLVTAWEISSPFDWSVLADKTELPPSVTGRLAWTKMAAEPDGLVNIARINTLAEGANGAFARLVIESPDARVVPFVLGFSDVARVFLNRALKYGGSNVYQSRDYRYLGTIGFFDTVYLDLEPGRNELLVAVGENFGGWGLKGRLDASGELSIVD